MAEPIIAPAAIPAVSPAATVFDEDTDCGGGNKICGGDNNGDLGGDGGEGTDGGGSKGVDGGGGERVEGGGGGDEVGEVADMDGQLVCQYLCMYVSSLINWFSHLFHVCLKLGKVKI
jgi:hypothetical protein